jgi:serine/threonine protein kinase
MGSVLLAEDHAGGSVVLKIPLHSTPEVAARMEDEARIGMQLRHPHIVKTLDFFMDGPCPVIVINHIDGTSLRELRDTIGPLPPAMVARVGEQISDALSALHHLKDNDGRSLEILHRDVTPGNILVDRAGNACLIDLGIARSVLSKGNQTSVGVLRGTFRYISPDLFSGKNYSWMTDLWALGVTLFEASVGRKATEGNEHQVFGDIMNGRITNLRHGESLNPVLRYLFDGLLLVDAERRRFRDPEDVLHAFRVIRGRLGDGEHDTVSVMASVPIPMDEELMEATEIVADSARDVDDVVTWGPTAPPPAFPSMMPDDFNEPTVVSAPTFNHLAANDDMRTLNTGFRADRFVPGTLPPSTSGMPPPPLYVQDRAKSVVNIVDDSPNSMTGPMVMMEEVNLDDDE